jgi:hypothetical protein
MKKAIPPRYLVALLLIGFSACEKRFGEAVVLAKRRPWNRSLVRMRRFVPWRTMRLRLMDTR